MRQRVATTQYSMWRHVTDTRRHVTYPSRGVNLLSSLAGQHAMPLFDNAEGITIHVTGGPAAGPASRNPHSASSAERA